MARDYHLRPADLGALTHQQMVDMHKDLERRVKAARRRHG